MPIAIIGCGYVADLYVKSVGIHPELQLLGVMDRNRDRARRFAAYHSTLEYQSLHELLTDPRVEIVVNLTNPRSHFSVSRACLEAGKHVYTEKPLAMNLAEAQSLVELAEKRGLHISSAPCSLLGETAQTVWKALRENRIGRVYLAYAELDDGLVHKMPYRKWLSESGTPWPYKDEFEVGCTLEHAGYFLTWLVAFFGPAQRVVAFSSLQIPDKATDVDFEVSSPDFSVACIKFGSGVVARLTCSIIAPHDHTLRIIGDEGILYVKDCWFYRSPVSIRRRINIRRSSILSPWKRRCSLVGKRNPKIRYRGASRMDWCRGIAELAEVVVEKRPSRLSGRFCLHVNEVALAIQNAYQTGAVKEISSSFEPIAPMPWALGGRAIGEREIPVSI